MLITNSGLSRSLIKNNPDSSTLERGLRRNECVYTPKPINFLCIFVRMLCSHAIIRECDPCEYMEHTYRCILILDYIDLTDVTNFRLY